MSAEDVTNEKGSRSDVAEPARFAGLFKAEWARLRSYLTRYMPRPEAEEIAQEAFLRLYKVKDEVRSPTGLLYHTARNLMLNARRDQAAAARVLDGGESVEKIADQTASPEHQVELRDRLERAAVMLDRMPSMIREVFLLQVIDGLTYAEIATRMGISVVGVKKRLLRAFEICAAHAENDDELRVERRNQRGRVKKGRRSVK